jgi:competence protein ComEA
MKNLKKIILVVTVLSILGFLTSGELYSIEKKVQKKTLVNINTAGVETLKTLPRIGVKVAKRIIQFRNKHGKFKKIEDLMKVKGIGEKMFLKLKSKITI